MQLAQRLGWPSGTLQTTSLHLEAALGRAAAQRLPFEHHCRAAGWLDPLPASESSITSEPLALLLPPQGELPVPWLATTSLKLARKCCPLPGVLLPFGRGAADTHMCLQAGMIPIQMELGGKDACIVCADADLELASKNVVKVSSSRPHQLPDHC